MTGKFVRHAGRSPAYANFDSDWAYGVGSTDELDELNDDEGDVTDDLLCPRRPEHVIRGHYQTCPVCTRNWCQEHWDQLAMFCDHCGRTVCLDCSVVPDEAALAKRGIYVLCVECWA